MTDRTRAPAGQGFQTSLGASTATGSDGEAEAVTRCRGCGSSLLPVVLDLGHQPACDHFPPALDPGPDPRWPLALALCGECALLQLDHISPAPEEPLAVESATLQAHALAVTDRLLQRINAQPGLRVREFASHHGGCWAPALAAAGCEVVTGPKAPPADVVIDNQSIIHAEDPQDQLRERVAALADDGLLVIEFHHALAQLTQAQFDTVRHGHPLYFSLHSWSAALRRQGLTVVDAWPEDVFGGCLIVLARRLPEGTDAAGADLPAPSAAVTQIFAQERAAGIADPASYADLSATMRMTIADLRAHVAGARDAGRRVAAYGAGSKACTLLGVSGLDVDDLPMVADLAPGKHGRRVPGTSIPIVSPTQLVESAPDDVVILTWDIAAEVVSSLRAAGLTRTRFVVPLPRLAEVD